MQDCGELTAQKPATAGMETAAATLWRASATVRLDLLDPAAIRVCLLVSVSDTPIISVIPSHNEVKTETSLEKKIASVQNLRRLV